MVRRLFRNLAFYAFWLGFVTPLLRWVVGVRYRKRHHVPEGPCLVVANHNSHLDASVLLSLFPLRRLPNVHPVAAADYFGRSWLLRTMAMLLMNAIPIERRPVAGQDPLAPIAEALKDGKTLIFFPEGSRGEAGVVAPFRPGIGRLVCSVPGLLVVPVFLSGPERIWPRGQRVPVPLSIDVNVGRPRTYSHEKDVREIAEQVRRDVLALAPPPPPVPAPRPSPPLRIAVCGIDNEARGTVFQKLTERFGKLEPTLGIGEPMLTADAEGLHEVVGPMPLTRSRSWLGLLAWIFRTSGRFQGSKFGELVERAAIDEALDHGRAARVVVGGGNALVDLLAWAEADFYRGIFDESGQAELMHYLAHERNIPFRKWWRLIRKAPEVWLLNVFDLARLLAPDVVVLLNLSPAQAMQRLRSRGRELQPFENEEFLGRLQEAYRKVAGVLRKRRRTEVLDFDLAATAPDEIAEQVEQACRRFGERVGRAAPGGS